MQKTIAHTKPYYGDEELQAVSDVVTSRMVNQGERTRQLVETVSSLTGCAGGVPVSSGTLGLHLALTCLGIQGPDDEVIVPDFACRSLHDSIKTAGGTPVFCDINLTDYSLDIESVRSRLTPRTRAIILPHMYGRPADIDAFLKLGIPIIEDCAHCLGVMINGRPVGSIGSLSVFSFEGSKLIAAGEGGLVLARERGMLEKLSALRYGLDGRAAYHYRLSDLVSAVVLAQVDKLPDMLARRRRIAGIYRTALTPLTEKGVLRLPGEEPERQCVWYRFVAVCNRPSAKLIAYANRQGILIRNPLTSGCLSATFGDGKMMRPNANAALLAANGVSLPIYPDLSDADAHAVARVVHDYFDQEVAA